MSVDAFYDTVTPELWADRFVGLEPLEDFELAVAAGLMGSVQGRRRVLDIGCGTGRIARLFAHDAYVGVDRAQRLVSYAVQHARDGRQFLVADMSALPFREGAFGLIVLMGTLESTKDPVGSVNAIASLLEPGGQVFLTLQNKRNWPARFANLLGRQYRQTFWSYRDIRGMFDGQWEIVDTASVFLVPPGAYRVLLALLRPIRLRKWALSVLLKLERANVTRRLGLGYEWQISLRRQTPGAGNAP